MDRVNGLNTEDFPVENVLWEEAEEFYRELNRAHARLPAGWVYQLRAAQWNVPVEEGRRLIRASTSETPSPPRRPTSTATIRILAHNIVTFDKLEAQAQETNPSPSTTQKRDGLCHSLPSIALP